MTNLQEAKLAREAEMSYCTVAMVTDYDCWHPAHDAVTVETVIEYLTKNSANAQSVAVEAVKRIPDTPCPYASALKECDHYRSSGDPGKGAREIRAARRQVHLARPPVPRFRCPFS